MAKQIKAYLIRTISDTGFIATISPNFNLARSILNVSLRNIIESDQTTVENRQIDLDPPYQLSELWITCGIKEPQAAELILDWLESCLLVDWSKYCLLHNDQSLTIDVLYTVVEDRKLTQALMFENCRPIIVKTAPDTAATVEFQLQHEQIVSNEAVDRFANDVVNQRVQIVDGNRLNQEQALQIIERSLNKKPSVWAAIDNACNTHEYPSEMIVEHGGIPTNTCYAYVSETFLKGLVNYAGIKKSFLINRYGFHNEEGDIDEDFIAQSADLTPQQRYESAAQYIATVDSGAIATIKTDDVIMFGDTALDYWVFWFDCDSSDCFLWRLEKATFTELTLDGLVTAFNDDLKARYVDWKHDHRLPEAIIVPIPFERFPWIC